MSGIMENFRSDMVWDTMHAGCLALLDHDSKLSSQARNMAEAEVQDDPLYRGEAAFEFFYGDDEDRERHRIKRESDEAFGLIDLIDKVCEVVQQEYLLNHFREEVKGEEIRHKQGARVRRQAVATGLLGGLLAANNNQNDDDDDDAAPQYDPYVAEIAYFFPVLDFFIPFDGSFNFLEQKYDPFNLNK